MKKSNFFVLKPVLSVFTAVLIFAGCEKQPANSVLVSTDGVLKDENSVLSSGNSCSSEEAPPPENEYEPKMRECRDPSYYNDLYSADSLPDVTFFCAIFEEKLGQIDEYMPLTEEESSDLPALLRVSEWVDLPEDYELRGEFSGSTTIFVSENAGTLYRRRLRRQSCHAQMGRGQHEDLACAGRHRRRCRGSLHHCRKARRTA